jgi:hypothetical protein
MNDQPAYVTREEFERRMRVLEGEVTGEKHVTRHILEQTMRNGGDLAAVRVEIATLRLQAERAAGDIALIKAAQSSQGSLLNVLTRDTRAMRAEMGDVRQKLDALTDDVAAIRAAVVPRDPTEE